MILRNQLTRNLINVCRHFSYEQGQRPTPNVREYFYYIDHEGMLFLDDAKIKNFTSCLKEKKFLKFFFNRVKLNNTKRYDTEFPYISPCGRELNYIRCDDVPIVYTEVKQNCEEGKDELLYAHAGDLLKVDFQPEKIYMNPTTGRVYHPAWQKVGDIGLIRSKLAIELSKNFEFNNGEQMSPTHFNWRGKCYPLKNDWILGIKKYGIYA
ncbi:UPF0598 protein CG30010 [Teleopsis dalmanni]|uniref:UPF0598 protein CG30010 n=1 Tax=Teleopsis dalmanni TaxID=139649 RepID=UPI000D32A4C7|nr:UPF0598 protein CG30010 [Teleopsis dalmanni]